MDNLLILITNKTIDKNLRITSHISHVCSQQSYFTSNNILMEEVAIQYVYTKLVDLKYTVNDDLFVAFLDETKRKSVSCRI